MLPCNNCNMALCESEVLNPKAFGVDNCEDVAVGFWHNWDVPPVTNRSGGVGGPHPRHCPHYGQKQGEKTLLFFKKCSQKSAKSEFWKNRLCRIFVWNVLSGARSSAPGGFGVRVTSTAKMRVFSFILHSLREKSRTIVMFFWTFMDCVDKTIDLDRSRIFHVAMREVSCAPWCTEELVCDADRG